jgi:hypothetical protein
MRLKVIVNIYNIDIVLKSVCDIFFTNRIYNCFMSKICNKKFIIQPKL